MFFPETDRQRDGASCTDRSPRGRDSKGRARLELFSQKQVFGKTARQRRPLVPLSRPPLSPNGERGGNLWTRTVTGIVPRIPGSDE